VIKNDFFFFYFYVGGKAVQKPLLFIVCGVLKTLGIQTAFIFKTAFMGG